MKQVDACKRLGIDPEVLADRLVIGFVGTFGKVWHPGKLVQTARVLSSAYGQKAPMFLIGGDGHMRESIASASKDLPNVILLGWLNDAQIRDLLCLCNIGAIPSNVETTNFPNKAFTYLSASLPIASSVGGDLRVLIEEWRCGFNYDYNCPSGLADALERFIRDPRLLDELKANANRVFYEKLEESTIYKEFGDFIEVVASQETIAP